MRKTSHEIDPSSTSQKSEKIPFLFKPLELQPIKEFISHSKILFTKYQTSSNYQYYRDLGSNIFQALAYIYIEEILHFGTVTYMTSWLEFLRSEESDFFKNLFFQSKMPKKFLEPQNQEIYHKSEAVFFEAFEKYLDALLTNPKDRTYLCYDFYFQCLYSEELRRFCTKFKWKDIKTILGKSFHAPQTHAQLTNTVISSSLSQTIKLLFFSIDVY